MTMNTADLVTMKTADLVTIRLQNISDSNDVTAVVELADWLDLISAREAKALLNLAVENLEAEAMRYHILSIPGEGGESG